MAQLAAVLGALGVPLAPRPRSRVATLGRARADRGRRGAVRRRATISPRSSQAPRRGRARRAGRSRRRSSCACRRSCRRSSCSRRRSGCRSTSAPSTASTSRPRTRRRSRAAAAALLRRSPRRRSRSPGGSIRDERRRAPCRARSPCRSRRSPRSRACRFSGRTQPAPARNLLEFFLLPFAVLVAVVGRAPFPPWMPRALGHDRRRARDAVRRRRPRRGGDAPAALLRPVRRGRERVLELLPRHLALPRPEPLRPARRARDRRAARRAAVPPDRLARSASRRSALLFAGLFFSYSQSSLVALFAVTLFVARAGGRPHGAHRRGGDRRRSWSRRRRRRYVGHEGDDALDARR